MDPRYQTQNNSPYPQNNGYIPPQSHPGPNLYPTLPPINNPQYNHPPQQYPQHPPQNNPYNPPVGRAGYVPLGNHGNLNREPNQNINGESFMHIARIKELEKGLEGCFIKCYQAWLLLTIGGFAMGVVRTLMALPYADDPFLLQMVLIYSIWAIIQSTFGILAVSQKRLNKANVACWMMVIYVIPSIFMVIWLSVAIYNHVPDTSDDSYYLWYVAMESFLFMFVVNTLTGVFVNLKGAFRVRNLLRERKTLQEKIDRSEESIHA